VSSSASLHPGVQLPLHLQPAQYTGEGWLSPVEGAEKTEVEPGCGTGTWREGVLLVVLERPLSPQSLGLHVPQDKVLCPPQRRKHLDCRCLLPSGSCAEK
jgi:hypothetical protein